MQKMKTAIVGCGKVGHFHAKSFAALDCSDFVAVCDTDSTRAREFAAIYGVKAYICVSEMVKECGVQLVSICTPHPVHAKSAVEAIEAGAHVLIEKPLAASLADCDLILNAAQKANVKVGLACQRRFYRPSLRLREAIDNGKIGKPILSTVMMLGWRDMDYYSSDPWRGTWAGEGGGVLVNQSPHQLDLLLWYMGEIDEVYGMWDTLNHPGLEVEDTAIAVIRFKNGGLGNIVVSNSQNPALYGKVYVHGSNGASIGVQTDGGAMFIAGMTSKIESPVTDLWTVQGEAACLEAWKKEDREAFESSSEMHHYHQVLIEQYISAVLAGGEPLVTGEDGRRTVELFTAIYRSRRDGMPQKFPLDAADNAMFDGRKGE